MTRTEALPSASALEEVRRLAGPSAVILDVTRLKGGRHADTWRVDTADPTFSAVVRQFPMADCAARHEQRVLQTLSGLGGFAPVPLGVGKAASRSPDIVDWSGAARGPRGFDLGWCRLDLVLLFDERIADVFLAAYEAATGQTAGDVVLWDGWAVARSHDAVENWAPNYAPLGRGDLSEHELRRRHSLWTTRLLVWALEPGCHS
jgi:hypothetical protein